MSGYVMAVQISGSRNGVDWPPPGQPVAADMDALEIAGLVGAGLARAVDPPVAAAPVNRAEVSRPIAPERRARARRASPGGAE